MSPPSNIVIVGGGIAGVSSAYYLSIAPSRPPNCKITIVEGTGIAAAASGYSGGFLAKDWHGASTASLSALSWDLHRKLADEFGGREKWGYRTVDTLSIETDATRPSKKEAPLPWLPNTVQSSRSLGTPKTTAQVHPGQLTKFLSSQFLEKPNTSLVIGQAIALKGNGKVEGVTVKTAEGERDIRADVLVLAAGPWTGRVAKSLLGDKVGGKLGVEGHRAHSVVYHTKKQLSAHCLFTHMRMEDDSVGEPEVYARPDGESLPTQLTAGTTYVCGAGDDEPLPETAAEVRPSPEAIKKLHKQSKSLSTVFDPAHGAEIQAEQACYLPIPERGRPLIGKVKGIDGVYIGGGLSCWGITQGPGTGKVLSELILDGKVSSADISKLAP